MNMNTDTIRSRKWNMILLAYSTLAATILLLSSKLTKTTNPVNSDNFWILGMGFMELTLVGCVLLLKNVTLLQLFAGDHNDTG